MSEVDGLLESELRDLEAAGLRRRFPAPIGPAGSESERRCISLGSNDYLGLARHPEVIAAASIAVAEYGAGATGSRLTSGNLEIHDELERALTRFKDTEAALLFPTGYQAAIGTITALVGGGDLIISDALNHASLIDGCRLSGAAIRVFEHNNMADVRIRLADRKSFRNCLIVTEGVFSMDGDLAPLLELAGLRDEHDCILMVDDAHGTGVIGSSGAGAARHAGVVPDIQMGTLSKALGSTGGFVCGSKSLIDYLLSNARSFIFTTALSPASTAAALASLHILQREPELVDRLAENSSALRKGLRDAGLNVPWGITPIIPVLIGDPFLALRCAQLLNTEYNYQLTAIRPPTVPHGTSRLRVSATALLDQSDIGAIVANIAKSII